MTSRIRVSADAPWYDLFSRGARDWLRHNQKVRQAVNERLLDLLASGDFISNPTERTVRVPVRMLEHARFRLADPQSESGAGQGKGEVGDVLRPSKPGAGDEAGKGGTGQGEFQLMVELKLDDLVDWLWEELQLPDLKPKPSAAIDEDEIVREGISKRGIRARLDRRLTVKEAVKRRAIQSEPVPFVDDDLRFRQLKQRPRRATNAVVMFGLDVSASMTTVERQLAKTFFFFALQGLRRQYQRVETRFIAHTTDAWEFSEKDFFDVTGSGGTMASSAFRLALDLLDDHYEAAQYNAYLFYASDGENSTEDRPAAGASLQALAERLNYIGYLETRAGTVRFAQTDMRSLMDSLAASGAPVGSHIVSEKKDIWQAIRQFFVRQAGQEARA
ncbi:MAG: DUF444 family protein [Betaproteobacteria bacterium]|nr:MAG: DUF444 family protein [Betaproteobacteria bacterium]